MRGVLFWIFFIQDKMTTPASDTSISWWGEATVGNRAEVVRQNARWKSARLALFDRIRAALDAEGVVYWVDSGSLLGAWRDGSMIPHDSDTDIGVAGAEMHRRARRAVEARCPDLAIKTATYSGKWEIYDPSSPEVPWGEGGDTWHLVSCDIDLYLKREDGWQQQYFNFGIEKNRFPDELIFPLGTITFEGRVCPAPAQPRPYLEVVYGYLGADCEYDKKTQKFVRRPPA